ncbi:MAG: cytochrome c peroxidase [Phenylobacterium sp.]|jgi:cytochrome c peroxidase
MNKLLILPLSILLCGCGSDNDQEEPTPTLPTTPTVAQIDLDLTAIIQANGLVGDAFVNRDTPDISSDIAQLGKHLFFSKSLSGDRDTACVTCHHPMLGGGDNLSLAIGVGAELQDLLGEGRLHSSAAMNFDGGPTVPRNSPSTFNLGGWDKVIFNDGRVESIGKTANEMGSDGLGIRTPHSDFGIADTTAGLNLAHAQARFPITSDEEMKGFNHTDKDDDDIRQYLASRIGGYGEAANELTMPEFWLEKFKVAFKQPNASAEQLITEQNIAFALGEYELSQVFVNNPWRQYVGGDATALTEPAKRGAKLFYQSVEDGGANCASCHSGDFFTDEQFHNIAAPQFGHGKGHGDFGRDDFGRSGATGDEAHKYQFRTPTLLNVAQTGPWMHTGAYTDLRTSVKHSLNPQLGIDSYDSSQLTQTGITNLDDVSLYGSYASSNANFQGTAIDLSDEQIDDLMAFLQALTDPCVVDRECMAPWIAVNDATQDPNGDQLNAVDQNGDPL